MLQLGVLSLTSGRARPTFKTSRASNGKRWVRRGPREGPTLGAGVEPGGAVSREIFGSFSKAGELIVKNFLRHFKCGILFNGWETGSPKT